MSDWALQHQREWEDSVQYAPLGEQHDFIATPLRIATAEVFKKGKPLRTPLQQHFIDARLELLRQRRAVRERCAEQGYGEDVTCELATLKGYLNYI